MAKFGKWIGGGLGWAFFGPVGGILGFVIGSFLDYDHTEKTSIQVGQTTAGDFAVSLLVLVAAVMKADGKILKSELDYVKAYFVRTFGESAAREAILMLRDILKQDIPLKDVAGQIGQQLDQSSKMQMLHLLFEVANADRHIHPNELKILQSISIYMGLTSSDFDSIKSMYVGDENALYAILETSKDASDDEIRKAYRKMAVQYHPDKVEYLGENHKKVANERFQKINETYEKIKKIRGMN
jgi:DnaJ like chaperone protein